MSNVITKEWMDAHDAVVQGKLQPLADAAVVKTLSSAPTEATLTYMIGTETHNFKIGDEARVADSASGTGYVYYKLYDINNGAAVWNKLGSESSGALLAAIRISLQAIVNGNVTDGTDLNGVAVSVQNVTDNVSAGVKAWAGNELVFDNLAPMKQYTVSVAAVSGYDTPSSYTINSLDLGQTASHTFQYTADGYTVSITSNQGATDAGISSGRLIYNGTSYANEGSFKVPTDTNVTASELSASALTGYASAITVNNKTISLVYSTEILTVTITKSEGDGDISSMNVTVKDSNNTVLGTLSDGQTLKIATGTSYTATASEAPEGYKTPAAQTASASQTARTMSFEYTVKPDGIDMGNGVLWATSNLTKEANGTYKLADNPWDYGAYFSWGDTEGHDVAGQNEGYDFSNSNYNNGASGSGHNLTASFSSGNVTYDAARAKLGDSWRIPTKDECNWLLNPSNCTNEWVTNYEGSSVAGRLFTSKVNGNKLFFPAAGYYYGTSLSLSGTNGYYWSTEFNNSSNAYCMSFYSSNCDMNGNYRYCGHCVRPVQ